MTIKSWLIDVTAFCFILAINRNSEYVILFTCFLTTVYFMVKNMVLETRKEMIAEERTKKRNVEELGGLVGEKIVGYEVSQDHSVVSIKTSGKIVHIVSREGVNISSFNLEN